MVSAMISCDSLPVGNWMIIDRMSSLLMPLCKLLSCVRHHTRNSLDGELLEGAGWGFGEATVLPTTAFFAATGAETDRNTVGVIAAGLATFAPATGTLVLTGFFALTVVHPLPAVACANETAAGLAFDAAAAAFILAASSLRISSNDFTGAFGCTAPVPQTTVDGSPAAALDSCFAAGCFAAAAAFSAAA
ncbi:hypothetical protein OGAPHI_001175 [Ogataea philodendri]|uniref:Uncharacterized protein n=1 Tax=Ogataea philodendri TaxID=1378263 RepID=A0A9P8PFL8_9ASCO|nr:uncharacterized protein OGAPHI_001175 [Ogataea philodendri]KAH3670660.1 hypothetical protein OGAPHI_001175 [Ogataea philodendri]